MIVPTSNLFKLAYGKYAIGAYNINNMEQTWACSKVPSSLNLPLSSSSRRAHGKFFRDHPEQFDFRPPGKNFVEEYAKFIAHKSDKLGSAGQLPLVRETLSGKIACSD
jgi:hypothetical protein